MTTLYSIEISRNGKWEMLNSHHIFDMLNVHFSGTKELERARKAIELLRESWPNESLRLITFTISEITVFEEQECPVNLESGSTKVGG